MDNLTSVEALFLLLLYTGAFMLVLVASLSIVSGFAYAARMLRRRCRR